VVDKITQFFDMLSHHGGCTHLRRSGQVHSTHKEWETWQEMNCTFNKKTQ